MTCTTARPVYGQFPKKLPKIRKFPSETKRNPMVQLVGENQLLRTTWPTLFFLHISIILFKIKMFFLFKKKRATLYKQVIEKLDWFLFLV